VPHVLRESFGHRRAYVAAALAVSLSSRARRRRRSSSPTTLKRITMNIQRSFAVLLLLGLFSAGVNAANVLTGKNGMTLYTFAPDANGKSACSGGSSYQ
jgi:predicted lipoprotein with Yx(FWY)xxD motif